MDTRLVRLSLSLLGLLALLLAGAPAALAQQVADSNFDASVARPAYTDRHPRVLFDEAHRNFHTSDGRYKPFADLIRNDGYEVTPNQQPFSTESLRGYDILVIANAVGPEGPEAYETPAFSEAECEAVAAWVHAGGALLLIADHAPFGVAAENLGAHFGVDMSKGHTIDRKHADPESGNPSWILYSRENGLLADHPITRGRAAGENVSRVVTFTGQSLKGPEGGAAILRLADTAQDRPSPTAAEIREAIAKAAAQGGSQAQLQLPAKEFVSAAGRAQGVALEFGKGRVVVLAEAAMLSAQLIGPERKPFGMNRPGADNRQFALNILHWLSRLLD